MSLKETLSQNLKNAMLSKDKVRTSTLRMLIAAVKNFEIAKSGAGYSATDEEVLNLVQKEIKQRQESIESFKLGNREDLVEKESKELEILRGYLPPQMSGEELRDLVKETIQNVRAVGINDMGKVMGALMPKVRGKAEGSKVSQIVKEELSS